MMTDTIDLPSISSATQAMRDGIVASVGTPAVFDTVRPLGPEGIKFDVWYCNTYLPALAAEYPVTRMRRYAAPSRVSYLAVGELQHVSRANPGKRTSSIPPMVESIERFVGQPLGTQRRRDVGEDIVEAAVVYPAFLRVPEKRLSEIDRWYDEEHLPILLSCPQWVMTRRFRITTTHELKWNHVALHYMTDLRALQSKERDLARSTPWRDKLLAEGWFAPEYRVCYRLYDF